MDSPVAGRFFKRLYSYCTLPRKSLHTQRSQYPSQFHHAQLRRHRGTYSQLRKDAEERRKREAEQQAEQSKGYVTRKDIDRASWQTRKDVVPDNVAAELHDYEVVTAEQLRTKNKRPRRVKILMRDFIEDSLYNPAYGYFYGQATIFDPGEPFDFNSMRSELDFHRNLNERYRVFEDNLDKQLPEPNILRQLWHTPTELFRPYYAEAIARHLIANYKISSYPYHDLIIYELGAGNGTFMVNVLNYIREMDPEVYARTKYKIIEISSSLAKIQQSQLEDKAEGQGHGPRVEIINNSILKWDTYIAAPCFVVCLEVIDNFGHDLIRYNRKTQQPEQASVVVDSKGEFYTHWEPKLDEPASRYLEARDAACNFAYPHPLRQRPSGIWPFRRRGQHTYTNHEYIPTRLLQFFNVLQDYFPAHRLLLSDFHTLPETVSPTTFNAPVVQTRYQRNVVPVSTPLVQPGFFDIFFPTDFRVMESIYRAVTGKLTRAMSHEEFMAQWADVELCTCLNGEAPLLTWYENAGVMTTV